MLKYLRIVVTVVSLTACVLLIGLWMRSYWWHDGVIKFFAPRNAIVMFSFKGEMYLSTHPPFTYVDGWQWQSRPVVGYTNWKFRFNRSSAGGYTIEFPHWFMVFLSAALAALPWIKWSRNFRLRTLLIATTLVAVLLALIVDGA